MIPQEEWKWFGYPGHLCISNRCGFHMCTRVGNYLISTIGHCFDKEDKELISLVPKSSDLFETMVFPYKHDTEDKFEDAYPAQYNFPQEEIDFERYTLPDKAIKGHMKFCNKYAELD